MKAKVRRKQGVCGSCSALRPVRMRSFWTTGLKMRLCSACERVFPLNDSGIADHPEHLRDWQDIAQGYKEGASQ